MEATTLSVGKAVLDGAVGYVKSAMAEEVAWQLGVQQDQAFIRDELQMMQAFLMAAHEEREGHKVINTWGEAGPRCSLRRRGLHRGLRRPSGKAILVALPSHAA